jgi:hypothetical protein
MGSAERYESRQDAGKAGSVMTDRPDHNLYM